MIPTGDTAHPRTIKPLGGQTVQIRLKFVAHPASGETTRRNSTPALQENVTEVAANFIATGPDRRAQPGPYTPAYCWHRGEGCFYDPGCKTPPARVDHSHRPPSVSGQHDGQAVSRQHPTGNARLVCPGGVGFWWRTRDHPVSRHNTGTVHLPQPNGLFVTGDHVLQLPSITGNAVRLITHMVAEIQAPIRYWADAATTQC